MKRCLYASYIIGKCKLKQRDTTIRLLEWQKSKILTTPNIDEDVEQQELSFIAGGNAKWYSHFESHLPYDPAIKFLGIYSNELNTKPEQGCLWHHYSKLPKLGSNQDVLQ